MLQKDTQNAASGAGQNDAFVRANKPLLSLMRRCGTHLGGVLSGKTDPREVMFPGGDLNAVESVYQDTPQSLYYNDVMAGAVRSLVDSLPLDRKLSVLEIGAGTGGTTSAVLPVLPADRTRYVFTDVSMIFALNAKRRFAQYPFVEYRALDISREVASQGFAKGEFDAVVCSNVLHATPDLEQTIANLKELLRDGGILFLREITTARPAMGFEIPFGCLLDPLADEAFRGNRPFLTPEGWEKALAKAGFDKFACFPDPADKAFDEHVMVARARGASRGAFSDQTVQAQPASAGIAGEATGHPLLGSRLPSPLDVAQYESRVSVRLQPFLEQHKVFNIVVVPGTGHFDLAAAAGMNYFGADQVALENVVLREALMLDSGERNLQVLVTPSESGAEFQIFSQAAGEGGAGGDWHLHVSGAMSTFLSHKAGETADLEKLRAECIEEVDVPSYYDKFDAYGAVQYGPVFRGLRRLWRSSGGAVAEVVLGGGFEGTGSAFVCHPAVLDSCLQSMVAALAAQAGNPTGGGFMPFSVEKIVFYGQAPETVWCQARMKEGDSFEQDMFSASFKIFTPEGRLVCEIVNLTMKRTSKDTLELLKAGQQQYGDLLYDIVWRPALPCAEPAKKEGSWLVFANRETGFSVDLADALKAQGQDCTLVTYRRDDAIAGMPEIDPERPEDFERVVAEWAGAAAKPLGVLFLWGLDFYDPDFEGDGGRAGFKTCTAEAFLHLVHAMGARQFTGRPCLAVMTCQAQAVRASDVTMPAQSLLWGLEKTVANELNQFRPLIVDLDAQAQPEQQLPSVVALLEDEGAKEDKIALRAGQMQAPRLVRSQPARKAARTQALERPEGEAFALDFSRNGIENIGIKAFDRPAPKDDEIELEVGAWAQNFRNVMVAMGVSDAVKVMVLDCAGKVTAVGRKVQGFAVGDRVMTTAYGPFASHLCAKASFTAKTPDGLTDVEAAGIPTCFMTAWHALVEAAKLKKGETVLLHSATGGVGLAAIQIARHIGADVIATAGTARKRALLRSMGIARVFSSRSAVFEKQVLEATGGEGVDVALNFLVKELADATMRCVKAGGRHVEIGKTDVRTPEQAQTVHPGIQYLVVDLEKLGAREDGTLQRVFAGVMKGFEEGVYHPLKSRVFTMDQAVDSFRYMMEGRHIGKVVVRNAFEPASRGVRADAAYIVTGGFSEVGLALAQHLAERGARHLWLLGRRLPEAGSEAEAKIKAVEALGCEIGTAIVDVTDRNAVAAFFAAHVQGAEAPLKGIFHLAGFLDDDVVMKLDWKRFNAVLGPKVDGSWFMHEMTRGMKLDHFVVFSSIASVFGTHGQANHVAANAFMDALVQMRRADFEPGLAIHWGAWGDIGTVVRLGILDRIRQQGVEGFDTPTGMAVLDRLMDEGAAEKVVTKMDWSRMLPILDVTGGAAMFSELRKARKAQPKAQAKARSEEAGASGLAEKFRAMPMAERTAGLKDYLKKEIAGFLRIAEESIPDDGNLTALGMDSLISLDLFQRISRDLKIRVAPHEMSANPTVNAMAGKFAHDLGPDVAAEPARPEAAAQDPHASMAALLVPEPDKAYEPFPLSDMQQAYWLGRGQDGMALGGVACHFYLEAETDGLDLDRYEQAWNRLVQRQPMLRTVILDGMSQMVLEHVGFYRITRHDFRNASAAEAEANALEVRERLSHEILAVDKWPNFRIEATQFPGGLVRMHFSFDLIQSDFHGIGLMMDDLGKIYAGEEDKLPRLEISFRDYRLAEERYRRTEDFFKDRDYWLKRIDGLPQAPKLPLAVNPAEITRPRFERKMTTIKREIWEQIKAKGEARGITPTAITLAAFAETIGKWSEEPQFTLNLTLFNRLPVHRQVDAIVGEFTSNSLLAVDLAKGGSFEGRAGRIWSQLWEDIEHRSFSGIRVLREMGRRSGRGADIMPVIFTSTLSMESSSSDFALGALGREVYSISQTPQVWIDHQLFEVDHELRLCFDYVLGLFPEGMVDAMFETYVESLMRLAEDDGAWGAESLPELPRAMAEVRKAVNATQADIPSVLMYEPFLENAARRPEAPAVVSSAGAMSYGELEARSRACALLLRGQGFRTGDRAAVFMDKGWEQVAAVLGIQRAGGSYLPLDVHQPQARIQEILKDAGAAFVLGQTHLKGAVDFGEGTAFIDVTAVKPAEEGAKLPESGARPGDLAYMIYTSGSTGKPKGVMITHDAAMNTVLDVNARYGIGAGDRALAVSRLSFDLSVYDIFGMLAAGGAVVVPSESEALDPEAWVRLVRERGVTLWNTVPALGQMLGDAAEKAGGSPLPLRIMIFSGDWIPVGLPGRLKELMPGLRVMAMGGATEASIWSNWHETGPADAGLPSVPYGRPLANQGFCVLDRWMKDRPDFVPGDLYITGRGLALGYWHDEEKTRAAFLPAAGGRPAMYRTGDAARYGADGTLEFLGRRDTQVKVHGYRIELGEIESVLKSHPAIGNAAVVVRKGQNDEVQLAAFVQADSQKDASLVAEEEAPSQLTGRLAEAWAEVEDYSDLDAESFLSAWDDVRNVYLAGALKALGELGLFDAPFTDESGFMIRSGVSERYRNWIRRALRVLGEQGLLARDGDVYRTAGEAPSLDESLKSALGKFEAMGFSPRVGAMLDRIARNLSSILREDEHSAEFYTDESVPDLYQKVLAVLNHLAAKIAARACECAEGRPYRILEVGAGYGTVTRHILPQLPKSGVSYHFTDISQFFLVAAQREFKDYGFVEYSLLNLDGDPLVQGLAPHAYDMIIAGNVLHDVAYVRKTLASLKGLLKPSGLLMILDQTIFQWPLELTEGLQQGFENFKDHDLRPDNPILTREQWSMLLQEQGCTAPVYAMPKGSLEERLGLDIMISSGPARVARFDPEALRDFLKQRLPEYMVPAWCQFLDSLPLTANGKVNRRLLAESSGQIRLESAEEFVAPRTRAEKDIAAIWRSILKIEKIGVNDSFFLSGGDSLSAFQLLRALQTAFGGTLSLRDLFQAPTIAAQAQLVGARGAGRQGSLVAFTEEGEGVPVLFAHPIEGLVTSYAKLAEALPGVPFYALQSRGLEGEAEPVRDFQAMVDAYMADTERLRQSGRLLLGGWSMGAFIAWEMAGRMQPDAVLQPLILLDPPAKDVWDEQYGRRSHDFAALMEQVVPNAADVVRAAGFDREAFEALPVDAKIKVFAEGLRAAGLMSAGEAGMEESLRRMLAVGVANVEALWQCRPRFLPGASVVYVRSAGASDAGVEYWRALAGGTFDVVQSGGDHWHLLQRQEDVELVASRIKACLAAARR